MDGIKIKQQVLDEAGGSLEGRVSIFTVTQLSTGKQFVGTSEGVERRFYALRSTLRGGKCNNPRLQEAWDASDESDWEFRVVDTAIDGRAATAKESDLVAALKPVFNQSVSGRRGSKGSKLIQAD